MSRVVVDGDPALHRSLAEDHRRSVSVEVTTDRGTRAETAAFPPVRRANSRRSVGVVPADDGGTG